ncbi:hypothetical protein A0J61_05617 [Choanephora cucurbitarum]|uniref:Tc1-like transposase DDE domain-containing protein n=1 Tax=Choanephora cucurbitarum TaxID=101091 RepID=A0A1C7NB81_9FUNG|nr:hypothetical protein A0J61_05617 [Choanephora cucurbitarum]
MSQQAESSRLASSLLEVAESSLPFTSSEVMELKETVMQSISDSYHQTSPLVSNGEDISSKTIPSSVDLATSTTVQTRKTPNKRNCEYKKYDDQQITDYINLITEGVSVKEAAQRLNITINTAYRYRKMWNKGGVTPVRNKRGPAEGAMSKLKEEHTRFIIHYIDNEKKDGALMHIREALQKEFPGLEVSCSALHRHMKSKCAISLKRIHLSPETRNDAELIAAIETWLASKDMDLEKNCVFVGEAIYSLHTSRHHGWKNRNKTDNVVLPLDQQRNDSVGGTNIHILGAISAKGVINVSTRKGKMQSHAERDDRDTLTTVSFECDQYVAYLMNVLNILDSHHLNGFYLLMDDAHIKDPLAVKSRIEERGYKCAFLPTVLPFPNPIEKFWLKTLTSVDRSPLIQADVSNRIAQACLSITPNDCCEWIQQSVPYSPLRLSSVGRGIL